MDKTTFEQWALRYMTDRGVWDDDASKILAGIKADKTSQPMASRWNDLVVDTRPDVMLPVLAMKIDRAVLAWCEKNMPEAWFKPMFET